MNMAQGNFRVRAYMVARTMDFLRERIGGQEAARVLDALSAETKYVVNTAKPAEWCSVTAYSEVNGAVAACGGTEAQARDALMSAGEYVAREATNTFLRLLMKMLTPAVFARKLPDFWRRDCSGGRLEVDASDQKLVCALFEMDGLNHVACTAAGFVKHALVGMGKVPETVNVHNWSLTNPCPKDAWFEITWSN